MLVHTLTYTPAAGKPLVTLLEWIATLPADQQTAFASAQAKQQAIDDANIASGALAGHEPGKVKWNNANVNVEAHIDPDWKVFFDRYLAETGTTLTVVESNE